MTEASQTSLEEPARRSRSALVALAAGAAVGAAVAGCPPAQIAQPYGAPPRPEPSTSTSTSASNSAGQVPVPVYGAPAP